MLIKFSLHIFVFMIFLRKVSSLNVPLFKFGVVADIQYTSLPDGYNFQKTRIRRYKQSLDILRNAVSNWKLQENTLFSIILGDTLDGQCASLGTQDQCLNDVKEAIKHSNTPTYFCYGNHDFYNFNREGIYDHFVPKLDSFIPHSTIGGPAQPDKLYYDFSPYKGYRCIVLDSYDISLIGATSSESKELAIKYLTENNPNDVVSNGGGGHWFDNLPLEKYRWVPYNGGIGDKQLTWLDTVLAQTARNSEKVFIFCHQPVYSPTVPNSLVWNAEAVLEILHRYDNVCLWMAGHDHGGQYCVDRAGIHHLIPPAPLEVDVGATAFGHVEVYEDLLRLVWTGTTPKRPYMPWPTDMITSGRAKSVLVM